MSFGSFFYSKKALQTNFACLLWDILIKAYPMKILEDIIEVNTSLGIDVTVSIDFSRKTVTFEIPVVESKETYNFDDLVTGVQANFTDTDYQAVLDMLYARM